MPEQDGSRRASQASFPEQDEIRAWAPDATQDAPLERGFRGEPRAHGFQGVLPARAFQDEQQEFGFRAGLWGFWLQALHGFLGEPRVRAFQGAPRGFEFQDERQERESRVELLAPWIQVSLGSRGEQRVLAIQVAPRVCGLQGVLRTRYASELAAWPRPVCADGRR